MNYETKVDELGRITISPDIMREIGITKDSVLEIQLEKNEIILSPYIPKCAICGSQRNTELIGGTSLCSVCISAIANDELCNSWNMTYRQYTRKVDELCRFVLPAEYRKAIDINSNTNVYLYVENNNIHVMPTVKDRCFACGAEENVQKVGNYCFCNKCMSEINKIAD